MSWATVQETVRDWVAGAINLPDFTGGRGDPVPRVEWENRRSAHRYLEGPWVDLRLSAIVPYGTDETLYEYIGNADITLARYVPTTGGYRTFMVSVKIGSESQEPSESALTLAGRFRTRLRHQRFLDILHTGGVALVSVEPTIEADYVDADGRMVSYAVIDVRLSTVEQDTDTDSDGDFVAEVTADATLEPVDGADIEFETIVP